MRLMMFLTCAAIALAILSPASRALACDKCDPEAKVKKIFEKHDADKDGKISLAEAKGTRVEGKFKEADADGDGAVSREEMLALKKKWMKMSPEDRARGHLERYDADKDGHISKAEAPNHWNDEKFKLVDTNGDGRIDLTEMVAHKKQRAKEKKCDKDRK